MAKNLSNVPVAQRIVISDEPIFSGRTASILISNRVLLQALMRLARENLFFAVTPYQGGIVSVSCPIDKAHTLADAVQQAEQGK
jgi:hypothetical protein